MATVFVRHMDETQMIDTARFREEARFCIACMR